MYQSQIAGLKEEIILVSGFDGCKVKDSNYNGIRIIGVRKLPNSINQGRQHLFIDLQNYRGVEYTCLLNESIYYPFNKPSNEVGCHIPIYGTDNNLKIVGINGEYSQTISGLSFAHTVYGHSSYYIYAVKTNTKPEQQQPSEAQKTIEEIEALLQKLKGIVK